MKTERELEDRDETGLMWRGLGFVVVFALIVGVAVLCSGCSAPKAYIEGPPPAPIGREMAYDESQDPAMFVVEGHDYFFP